MSGRRREMVIKKTGNEKKVRKEKGFNCAEKRWVNLYRAMGE